MLNLLNRPQPTVKVLTAKETVSASSAILLAMWQGKTAIPAGLLGKEGQSLVTRIVKGRSFNAEAGKIILCPLGEQRLVCFGLGKQDDFLASPKTDLAEKGVALLVKQMALAIKALQQEEALQELTVILPEGTGLKIDLLVRSAVEAVLLTLYLFEDYLSTKTRQFEQLWIKLPPNDAKHDQSVGQASQAGVQQGLRLAQGVYFARDLINHPASEANSSAVAEQVLLLGKACGAEIQSISGEALKKEGYGAIYAVGRAAEHPPFLLRMSLGPADAPELCLVGKGVCFDTGGLDIKNRGGMLLMKKDLGGAAIVLGAFWALATLNLPLRISVVVGLAENAISQLSYRPGDILQTKLGHSVEVIDTDAEGRLVLADAFALALASKPSYLVDFATLTGSCRVALGKEIMGMFCNHYPLALALKTASLASGEHCWQLPLYQPYLNALKSDCADIANCEKVGLGGAITAALFLQKFIGETAWAHLDCFAWSEGSHPLYPRGGSAQGVRLIVEATRLLSQQ